MPALVILCTAPDRRAAGALARGLVRLRLAACVSFGGPFDSVYSWKGKIESQKETLLLIKTSKKKLSRLMRFIQAHHPYEVPEIVALPVAGGSPKYLSWLTAALN